MCHNVEGIPRGSLFLDGQPGHECTKGIVDRLLMVISLFSKIPMKRRAVVGAHADTNEVHG